MDETIKKLSEIFVPTHFSEFNNLGSTNGKLVYYTSAGTALQILQNKEVWMRSTTSMNDFNEVSHGFEGLSHALDGDFGKALKFEIEKLHSGIFNEVTIALNRSLEDILYGSYITCLSRHHQGENKYGRLSMWRAYCAQNGVAIVLHNYPFVSFDETLGAFSSSVDYIDQDEYGLRIKGIADRVNAEADFIKSCDPDQVADHLWHALASAMLCTKHPAFIEEREWRVFHIPKIHAQGKLRHGIECVGGVPQKVYKIPLEAFSDSPLDLSIPTLLDRIIIGPCEFPDNMREAFIETLWKQGVSDAEEKVHISGVPLR